MRIGSTYYFHFFSPQCDLRNIGLTINDHFNPPPCYDRAVESAANANNGDYIANAYNNPSDLTRNCSR